MPNPSVLAEHREPHTSSGTLALVHSTRVAPSRPDRIVALDSLRGLMAWAVALYHFGMLTRAFPGGSWASSVTTVLGLHSVEAFFMISGFCLFHLHGGMQLQPAALRRFYWHRFVRIAPLFYFVLALNSVFQISAGPGFSWPVLLENLTFTFGVHHPNHALVTGGWSIGLEMLFYAAFPLLAIALRSLAATIGAALLAIALACLHTRGLEDVADPARFNTYVMLPNHAFAFLLGGVLAKLRARTSWRIPTWLALAVAGALLGLFIASRPRVYDHFDVVLGASRLAYVAASFALVGLFAFTRGASSRTPRWLAALGELSYPVYLLHPLAWYACRSQLPAETPPPVALGCALVATLCLSLAVYHAYERPIRRYFADRGPGRALRSV